MWWCFPGAGAGIRGVLRWQPLGFFGHCKIEVLQAATKHRNLPPQFLKPALVHGVPLAALVLTRFPWRSLLSLPLGGSDQVAKDAESAARTVDSLASHKNLSQSCFIRTALGSLQVHGAGSKAKLCHKGPKGPSAALLPPKTRALFGLDSSSPGQRCTIMYTHIYVYIHVYIYIIYRCISVNAVCCIIASWESERG